MKTMLTVSDVAKALSMNNGTAYMLISLHPRRFRVGKCLRLPVAALEELQTADGLEKALRPVRRQKSEALCQRKYGMSLAERAAMLKAQKNRCKICGRKLGDFSTLRHDACVDHCHRGKAVRGILCNACNRGLGQFNDSPEALRAAADYLEASRASEGPKP